MRRSASRCVLVGLLLALGAGGCGDDRTLDTDATVDAALPDIGPRPEAAPDGAFDLPPSDLRADAILTDGFPDAGDGKTCQTAIPILLQNNKGQATGEIKATDTDNDVTLKTTDCVGASTYGADRFYSVSLVAGQLYIIRVEGMGGFKPTLYVFGECSNVAGSCLAGVGGGHIDAGAGAGFEVQLAVTPTKNGTYYIGVDSNVPMGLPGSYGQYKVIVS